MTDRFATLAAKALIREGPVLKARDLGPVRIGASARLRLYEQLFALAFAHERADPAGASRIEERFEATLAILKAGDAS